MKFDYIDDRLLIFDDSVEKIQPMDELGMPLTEWGWGP
jgi:hypothetical protein